ncbi:hypothetical protein ACCO45_000623 [Purpureocillium lilacinum]|uniref:Uncharacterized protein n=1 Tax=Purpureocillium lilacinum TaxID=33203 RepID=A0ACC4E4R0_PURLI
MVSVTTFAALISGATALVVGRPDAGQADPSAGQRRTPLRTRVQLACAQGQYSSICAFYQNGASGTADRAAELLQGLIDHGCSECGSNPTQPGNDVSKGELTVNIVSAPCCKGACTCPI